MMFPPYNDDREVSEDPREIATIWVAAKSVAEGPLTNLAAVAADDAWGASRPRHWLAERAPANYTCAKELRHIAGSGVGRCRRPIKEGRTATAFDRAERARNRLQAVWT